MKRCGKCGIEKNENDFHDGRNHCKECRKEYRKKHNEENPDIRKKYEKKRYSENKESELKRTKEYRINNIQRLRKKDRDNYIENSIKQKTQKKKYRKENPVKVLETQKKSRKKGYQINPILKLKHNLRCRISQFLKIKNITKKNSTFDLVGCKPYELKEHLQKKFLDNMCWDNYGDWHIDHIIPLSSATNEEETYKLCHYTNLQPLWAEDNLKKSNKIL
jgi:hypothetical protein